MQVALAHNPDELSDYTGKNAKKEKHGARAGHRVLSI
jgi:hypothetical protein